MKTARLERLGSYDFFVRRWGDPALPPLLCLHGFPEFGGAWNILAPLLAHRFHVIAPDQRGYGRSYAPTDVEAVRMSRLVADMTHLITGRPTIVLGHDWGASVAYMLAVSSPKQVSRLVIANGVHPVPFQRALARGGPQTDASQYIHNLRAEGSQHRLARDGFAGLLKLLSADMNLDWLTPETEDTYITEWSRPGRLHAMINWYRASPLAVPQRGQSIPMPQLPEDRLHIHCPHLLIWGKNDTALLPEATKGLEHFAPNLTRVTLEHADHWLIHQRPQDIAEIILDWLP